MKLRLPSFSIRTRLLVVYIGILLAGFGGLMLIAGEQLVSGARVDYTQQLKSRVLLIAQGVEQSIANATGNLDQTVLTGALDSYRSTEDGIELNLIVLSPQSAPLGRRGNREHPDANTGFIQQMELETAVRGETIVVERANDAGEAMFYTAAPVTRDGQIEALIQLSVPSAHLGRVLFRRRLLLLLVVAVVLSITVVAALLVSRSIIRPLYRLRESALKLSQGDLSHRVTDMGTDEIGAVARAFNEMATQVQGMLEEQRAFASNTSHELRTPLTTIRLRSEALRYETGIDAATSAQYVVDIDEEIKRLSGMVEDLTLLSRFDAGRAELGQSEIDMVRLADSLTQQHQADAAAHGVTLRLDVPDAILPIRGSLNHLMIIFRNLLDNAIKYTPVGGQITWTVKAETAGVRSVIQDTGLGIAPENLPHVFERFFRADKARVRDVPGTGLGLALVQSIVSAYGGSVTVESPGLHQGTTVTVFLPSLPAETTPA